MRLTYLLMFMMMTTQCGVARGVTFEFSNQGNATQQMMQGTALACAMWSQRLVDPITVRFKINAITLPAGQIGSTSSFYDPYSYTDVRSALHDTFSLDDISSSEKLLPGSVHSMLINRTANNPAGVVSPEVYLDDGLGGPGQAGPENNNTVRMTSANAKALGLYPPDAAGLDATINFTTLQPFDFDPSDGISAGKVDFVGVAAHEIGHMLGFLSGVDGLGRNATAPGFNDNQLLLVTPEDLFRFSTRSIAAGIGVHDWTADNTPKYFSVDGGLTSSGTMSNGALFGDGFEAHHWKNGLGLGIMNPSVGSGQLLSISNNDLRMLDVIGYDLALLPGDFDRSGLVDSTDIDLLFNAEAGSIASSASRLFDVNHDGQVINTPGIAQSDIDQLVHVILQTEYGDANLDRRVDFSDLLRVAQDYGDAGAGWIDGNFNGESGVDFADLLVTAQNYGFGTLADADSFESDWERARSQVPEPAVFTMLGFMSMLIKRPLKRRASFSR